MSSVGGRLRVVPADAEWLLGQGRIDARLFDVGRLVEWGYDDAHRADVPLIAEYPEGGRAGKVSGAQVRRSLPDLGLDALSVPKGEASAFWGRVTGPRVRALSADLSRLWLDGKNKALLDRSVPQIGAPAAWRKGLTGKGVTVAVLDSGYDAAHRDLRGVVGPVRGFTDNGAGDVRDRFGHGTHVASTVAGSGGASNGKYRGVAPGARLAIGKVLDDEGEGPDSWIIAGMRWAATEVRAKVVSMSFGGPDAQGIDPVERAVATLTTRTGTLFVAAAGNEGEHGAGTVGSPGSSAAALTVGAVDRRDRVAESSSRGPRIGDHAVKPDITAPGVGIVAAWPVGVPAQYPVGASHARLSGTSMATPHAAGAAAIMVQRHPGWRADRLKAALMSTARPGKGSSAFQQGAGRVDLARATAQPVTTVGTTEPVYLRWPGRGPVAREITYSNESDRPVTLKLAVAAAGNGGGTAPRGLFRLARTSLAVPAKGTAHVRMAVDGRGLATGAYGGAITAASARGVSVRTVVGAYVEPKMRTLTIRAIHQDGRPADSLLKLVDLRTGIEESVQTFGGQVRLRVRDGNYALHGAIDDFQPGKCKPLTFLSVPVAVRSDRRVTVDARGAREVKPSVDEPSAEQLVRELFISHQGTGDASYFYQFPEEGGDSPDCPGQNP